ncbi:hypothetical protein [Oscillibacter sp.]|uniref:hypothetical protein n=1 Tax=Oscillibacter sp. TaxID=1945593 RepID=UPI00289AB507|nr:hypothetical protein [Oscillibacter sp.]
MRKAKKSLVLVLLAALVSTSIIPAHATEANVTSQSEGVTINAVENEWVYRLYNGQRQKRLWSNTKAEWLTDWMPV